MKLAKNIALRRNLEKQLPIYQAASDAKHGIKAIKMTALDHDNSRKEGADVMQQSPFQKVCNGT